MKKFGYASGNTMAELVKSLNINSQMCADCGLTLQIEGSIVEIRGNFYQLFSYVF